MSVRKGIQEGLHITLYNLVKCGYDVHEAANKMGLRFDLAHRLFNYEFAKRKENYQFILPQTNERQMSFSEMQMRGESYKRLYLPHYEEKQTITKMSKV